MSRPPVPAHHHKSKALDGKYMLGDEIGKGAYGRVYKGLDLENGDFVAIKQVSLENIPQEDLNIIMQEIDLLKNLNHKNIVKYLGSLKTKTHLHIILEYVENGSLANIIKPNKFGPFPETLVVLYIAQVLEGLVYLHEQGVIHRDIKGANILTTKEGLVKLADFGVATKLNEADLNTHSVVGTPYWMAPEVIEMAGVCAASDIWSVGCTVIELLTCAPPYYDLQPMPALFRIVQDVHPPIPEGLSLDMVDFLHQCFKKDAMQRTDAKTLLLHPWIQNTRKSLQKSLHQTKETGRITELDTSVEISSCNGLSNENSSIEKVETHYSKSLDEVSREELMPIKVDEKNEFDGDHSVTVDIAESHSRVADNIEIGILSDQDPTLLLHEKPSISSFGHTDQNGFVVSNELPKIVSFDNVVNTTDVNFQDNSSVNISMGDLKQQKSSNVDETNLFSFDPKSQESHIQEDVGNPSLASRNDELYRFRDPPGDSTLEDLFQPPEKVQQEQSSEASTSDAYSNTGLGNSAIYDGNNDLASTLKARIAQKRLASEPTTHRSGGDIIQLMMGVLREDVIDIDGSVFDKNMAGDNLFPVQALDFGKLVGMLKAEETEDTIVSACQKLISLFQQRPEQKHVFLSQNGFVPLMELLGVRKIRVLSSVLQLINQIVKDNVVFQENACLIGLIPDIMNFAKPDLPREVRMQAAFFFQQLCQSSSLTLQMFIACRGIPVLVGFLEPDYAKYREMVHLAIDGMWQVFKLQNSSLRNDFCRLAAKSGILIKLINSLHSLNEATRLASISSGGGGILESGSSQRPRSGPLDFNHPVSLQPPETPNSYSGQLEPSKFRQSTVDSAFSTGTVEPTHISISKSQTSSANQPDLKRFSEMDKTFESHDKTETPVSMKFHELIASENAGPKMARSSINAASKDLEQPDMLKSENELGLQHRTTNSGTRNSIDSNGNLPHDSVRPLLSLLDKEPPSRHVSGQLDYGRHFSGLEQHDNFLPLLHASTERKTNGEIDILLAEFADFSKNGKEIGNLDSSLKSPAKLLPNKLISPSGTVSNEGAVLRSGITSQTASGVLSGSGVLNARPGSATSSGMLTQMVSNADVAREYVEKVADLLLEFSQADSIVKSHMCNQSLLGRLFQMFNKIEPPILTKILKCINNLSTDPNCLESLQRAGAIRHLIPNLELREGALVSRIHNEVLNALFNLCKINKRRQEQAAENGIIPHLMNFITSESPLKQHALPLLCDMAHASRNSREQLRAHGGLDIYLNLLEDENWAGTALDSLAVCLAHDNDHRKVEQALLKKEAIQKLVKFFQSCPEQYFTHILDPFLKIITKSSRINTTLAVNGLTTLLVARLDHQDAIARLNLLKLIKIRRKKYQDLLRCLWTGKKMIQVHIIIDSVKSLLQINTFLVFFSSQDHVPSHFPAVYEHHPRPKQLIVENDLPQKLQNLIEERRDGHNRSGGQVLVKQMATSLLKALHINTVL